MDEVNLFTDPLLFTKLGIACMLYLCAYSAVMAREWREYTSMAIWIRVCLLVLTVGTSVLFGLLAINQIIDIVKQSL